MISEFIACELFNHLLSFTLFPLLLLYTVVAY
jgi:hypothetical protein